MTRGFAHLTDYFVGIDVKYDRSTRWWMTKVWHRHELQAVFAVQGRCSTQTTDRLFRLIKLYQPHMTAVEKSVPL